jgi:hypothetical protein
MTNALAQVRDIMGVIGHNLLKGVFLLHKLGELNEQQYIDFEMDHIKKTSSLDDKLPFIQLLIRDAFRNGYEHAKNKAPIRFVEKINKENFYKLGDGGSRIVAGFEKFRFYDMVNDAEGNESFIIMDFNDSPADPKIYRCDPISFYEYVSWQSAINYGVQNNTWGSDYSSLLDSLEIYLETGKVT